MPNLLRLVVDCLVWAGWSLGVSWWGLRWTADDLAVDSWLTRPRRWEAEGRTWVRLGVRRWRRLIPDAGRWFGGRPRTLTRGSGAPGSRAGGTRDWAAMIGETRRAERVHWRMLAALPLFILWNGGLLLGAMVVYAVVANGPCLVVQRHNRARFRAVARRSGSVVERPVEQL